MHRSGRRRKRLFTVSRACRLDPPCAGRHLRAMTRRGDSGQSGEGAGGEGAGGRSFSAPGQARAAREARLAEQLRANLQRRKQQARQRAAGAGQETPATPAAETRKGSR